VSETVVSKTVTRKIVMRTSLSFAAAFFVSLRAGRSAGEAVAFANAAAAVRIADDGANAIGRRAAIEARLGAVG